MKARFGWILGTAILFASNSLSAAPPDSWPAIPWNSDQVLKEAAIEPGTPAVILYREDLISDRENRWLSSTLQRAEDRYYRIKILTAAGRRYGDVEIPFVKGRAEVKDLRARTIQPDGTIAEFKGEVHDKELLAARRLHILAKSFSLPGVQPGTIVEYRYTLKSPVFTAARWTLQEELPTIAARFSMERLAQPFSYTSVLPRGAWIKSEGKDGEENLTLSLELKNIPATRTEPFMPPDGSEVARVDFFYKTFDVTDPDRFWGAQATGWRETMEKYIGSRRSIRKEAEAVVRGAVGQEAQLHALYVRAQQIRNLAYDPPGEKEKIKANDDVADVLDHGAGYPLQINALFVALARAAGFSAEIVKIGERDTVLFNRQLLDPDQLNGDLAIVVLAGKESYFDPGTPLCPFGMISWEKTGVQGIRLGAKGVAFVETPIPGSEGAFVARSGTLDLQENGTLAGAFEVTYFGQEALTRRLDARGGDPALPSERIKKDIQESLPAGATIRVVSVSGWNDPDLPVRASVEIECAGFAATTGKRLLLPVGVFHSTEVNPFASADRVHAIYFRHAFQQRDDVTVRIPPRWKVESVPSDQTTMTPFGKYMTSTSSGAGTVRIQRLFDSTSVLEPKTRYPGLQSFFGNARALDEEKIVLQPAPAR